MKRGSNQGTLFETDAGKAAGAYGKPIAPAPTPPAKPTARPAPAQAKRPARVCLWPGCQCEPTTFACPGHQAKLPGHIWTKLEAAYTPGQENDRHLMTREYRAAVDAAQEWIRRHGSKA